jgi:hypothetical protein
MGTLIYSAVSSNLSKKCKVPKEEEKEKNGASSTTTDIVLFLFCWQ